MDTSKHTPTATPAASGRTPIETFDAVLPHGITLSCRAAGPRDAPRVLLVHGFPEAAFVWDAVMQTLAPRLRCTAPNLRGYERSSSPAEVEAYRAKHLMMDLEALVQQTGGAPVDLLVAHDWGGAVAWNLAAQRPQLMKRLLIINSPHPATLLRELKTSREQQEASAYMHFLCRPDAEALLAENDFARMWPLFERMGGKAWLDEATKARYREVWSMGMTGALNYYRASPVRPPLGADDPIHAIELPDAMVTARVPTTVLWGENDHALRPGLLDGLERWVPGLELIRVPEASHWIVHEQPQRVAALIERLVTNG